MTVPADALRIALRCHVAQEDIAVPVDARFNDTTMAAVRAALDLTPEILTTRAGAEASPQ